VDVGQSTCGLAHYFQAICTWVATNVVEDVPVAIVWSGNGGQGESFQSHRRRPNGGYVVVADSRPVFPEYVDHPQRRSTNVCVASRLIITYPIQLFLAFMIVGQDPECLSHDLQFDVEMRFKTYVKDIRTGIDELWSGNEISTSYMSAQPV
jgi:hypothetical protein